MVKFSVVLLLSAVAASAQVDWLPAGLPPPAKDGPTLCVRDYLTPEQGDAVLQAATKQFDTRATWASYADVARRKIQEGAGLAPWPRRTSLNAMLSEPRVHDGYTVQNVMFEPVPGVYACGNLYRPIRAPKRAPAVLATHGHTSGVDAPTDWARHGRFHESVQRRAATLARMGAVVLTIDLFGYGDSLMQFGAAAHRRPFSLTMQLWTNLRAIDFLASLRGVDKDRIAVTGESGGATEALLLTALEPRVAVTVPVAMVSSYFFGGCPCESGRPIHRSEEHFASNALIAALAAPRPMLVVSDGGDWTQFTPKSEFPFLQQIYRLYGAEDKVANVHLAAEGHDYGPSKRVAMYRFMGAQLGLKEDFDESHVALESPDAMRVFKTPEEIPATALRTAEAAEAALRDLQR
ncbi:MAG: acetylxylan esterase [Opitutae bacterium]|nr:acetylxylan esterase [Opitutae bacterium]